MLQRIASCILNTSRRYERSLLASALLLILVVGTATSVRLGDSVTYPDETDYLRLAQSIREGRGYTLDGRTPTAHRPPGYALLLSLFPMGIQPLWVARFAQVGLLATSVLLLSRILRAAVSSTASTAAAYLCLLYPLFSYAAGLLYPQILAGALFLFILKVLVQDHSTHSRDSLGGLAAGFLILTAPTFLANVLLLVIWMLLTAEYRRALRGAAMLALGALVVSAWSARNYRVFGAFVPISTNSGANLLIGNSSRTTPNAGVTVDISEHVLAVEGLDELARDRYFREQALSWIRENPWPAVRLYALKTINYFNYTNRLATRGEASPVKDYVMLATYAPLLAVLAARLAFRRRLPLTPLESLLSFLYVSNAFVGAIFFNRIRFRVPFDFLLVGFAAASFDRVTNLWESSTRRTRLRSPVDRSAAP